MDASKKSLKKIKTWEYFHEKVKEKMLQFEC